MYLFKKKNFLGGDGPYNISPFFLPHLLFFFPPLFNFPLPLTFFFFFKKKFKKKNPLIPLSIFLQPPKKNSLLIFFLTPHAITPNPTPPKRPIIPQSKLRPIIRQDIPAPKPNPD